MAQQVDIKQLSAIMNTDANNEVMPATHHKMAYNILWKNGRPEVMPGTTEIAYTKPTGTNETIGAFYYGNNGKSIIFWLMANASGNHSIFMHNLKTATTQSLIVENTNAASGVLSFDANQPIYSAKILTGDTVQGDEFWFLNSQKQPCKFSIDRAISGDYGTIQRSDLSVNFAPPIVQPSCTYENDATITVNNFRKKLTKIKIRYINTAKNKSVTSIEAEMALPVNYLDTAIDKDPTKNCRMAIVYPTGNKEVKKIEILAAENSGNGFNDYVLIKTINKAADGISDNDIAIYRYYNNEAYVAIDVRESLQVYDLVPLEASDLELLNGNVPIYCNIKEDYNPISVTGTMTSGSTPQATTQYPFVFKASQSGDSGFGTGNIHAILVGSIAVGNVFTIYTTTETITFTATVATTANVITGLAAAAVVAGFTVVSSDTENIVITKVSESLQRVAATATLTVTNSYVYDWNSRYAFTLQYFDENGVTIGSQTSPNFTIQSVNYTETSLVPNISKFTLSITNRPPLEAKYFSIGRSKNLTKLKWLYWVTARTFKDNEFAYIDITNLGRDILENPSKAHLAYDWAANDRIRFVKKISGTTQIYTDQDFEIQSQKATHLINGEEEAGQFLKIALPATSGTFDFGSVDFSNYYIQLYTPALSLAEGYNGYFEFGERFTIGDAGLSTRYHQGMTQNQTSNLSQPAIFEFTKGDAYYRNRKIDTNKSLDYVITAGERGAGRHTMGVNFVDRNFTDATITTGNSPLQDLSGWTFASNTRAIIKTTAGAVSTLFRARGTITFGLQYAQVFSFYFTDNTDLKTYAIPSTYFSAGGSHTLKFDCTFTLGASQHISFLGYADDGNANSKVYAQTDFSISVESPVTVPVIDPNFSDYFPSAVNSNGRIFIVDPNRGQATFKNLFRWGLARDFDTNLNRTNRFYDQNATEADLNFGAVQRMIARQGQLRYFQETGVGWFGVYQKIITDATGGNILTATDEIITKNNRNYYSGNYGLGNQPTGLVSGKSRDFFVDPVRGYQCMVGESGGIFPMSEQHYGQYFIQPLFPPYNKDYLRANGKKAKIMGYYDYGNDLYMTMLQGGTLVGFPTIPDYMFGYRDGNNPGYTSFFHLTEAGAEWVVSAEDKTYAWKNGSFYILNNTTDYCKFFGTQYYPSVRVVFNDQVAVKKSYFTSAYNGNQKWSSDRFVISAAEADSIKTSFFNPDTGFQQISELKTVDYSIEEGKYCAALLKDKNSGLDPLLAVLEGDELMGNWIEIEYLYRGSSFAWIFLPQVGWQPSNKNF